MPPKGPAADAVEPRTVTAPATGGHEAGGPESRAVPSPSVEPVPDFTLVDQYGVDVSLSSVAGQRNAPPSSSTRRPSRGSAAASCARSATVSRTSRTDDIQVFTISCDSMYTLRAWADAEGHFFPLSRTSGRTARWPVATASSTTSRASRCGAPSSSTATAASSGARSSASGRDATSRHTAPPSPSCAGRATCHPLNPPPRRVCSTRRPDLSSSVQLASVPARHVLHTRLGWEGPVQGQRWGSTPR